LKGEREQQQAVPAGYGARAALQLAAVSAEEALRYMPAV